nr:unnamed protein product [Callosobruchus analis]
MEVGDAIHLLQTYFQLGMSEGDQEAMQKILEKNFRNIFKLISEWFHGKKYSVMTEIVVERMDVSRNHRLEFLEMLPLIFFNLRSPIEQKWIVVLVVATLAFRADPYYKLECKTLAKTLTSSGAWTTIVDQRYFYGDATPAAASSILDVFDTAFRTAIGQHRNKIKSGVDFRADFNPFLYYRNQFIGCSGIHNHHPDFFATIFNYPDDPAAFDDPSTVMFSGPKFRFIDMGNFSWVSDYNLTRNRNFIRTTIFVHYLALQNPFWMSNQKDLVQDLYSWEQKTMTKE